MKENNVSEIVGRPTSTQRNRKPNIIDSKWVFRQKWIRMDEKSSRPDWSSEDFRTRTSMNSENLMHQYQD